MNTTKQTQYTDALTSFSVADQSDARSDSALEYLRLKLSQEEWDTFVSKVDQPSNWRELECAIGVESQINKTINKKNKKDKTGLANLPSTRAVYKVGGIIHPSLSAKHFDDYQQWLQTIHDEDYSKEEVVAILNEQTYKCLGVPMASAWNTAMKTNGVEAVEEEADLGEEYWTKTYLGGAPTKEEVAELIKTHRAVKAKKPKKERKLKPGEPTRKELIAQIEDLKAKLSGSEASDTEPEPVEEPEPVKEKQKRVILPKKQKKVNMKKKPVEAETAE